jgi:hypothetical protein
MSGVTSTRDAGPSGPLADRSAPTRRTLRRPGPRRAGSGTVPWPPGPAVDGRTSRAGRGRPGRCPGRRTAAPTSLPVIRYAASPASPNRRILFRPAGRTMCSEAHSGCGQLRRRVRPARSQVVGTAGGPTRFLARRRGPPSRRGAGRRGRTRDVRGDRPGLGIPAVGAARLRSHRLPRVPPAGGTGARAPPGRLTAGSTVPRAGWTCATHPGAGPQIDCGGSAGFSCDRAGRRPVIADSPVISRPTISACTWSVPSKV